MIPKVRLPSRSEYTLSVPADRMQRGVEETGQAFNALPFSNGTVVGPIEMAGSVATQLFHKLNRKPQGWFPIRVVSADGTTFGSFSETTSDERSLTLFSGGDVTATFWVF